MHPGFFGNIPPIRYEGPTSDNPLAFRHYDASRVVLGKSIAEHLRPAVCYWHNFAWRGSDMFGADTFERPWFGDSLQAAKLKADVAFEMFATLQTPFFSFHDKDAVFEGASLREFGRNLAEIVDYFQVKIVIRLLRLTPPFSTFPGSYHADRRSDPTPNDKAGSGPRPSNLSSGWGKAAGPSCD